MSGLSGRPESHRLVTFDLIRPILVAAVVLFLVWRIVVGEDVPTQGLDDTIYDLYRRGVGSVFNYAPLFLVGIAFMLWGARGTRFRAKHFAAISAGMLLSRLSQNTFWGFFEFILLSMVLISVIPRRAWLQKSIFISGVVLLSVPIKEWEWWAWSSADPWRFIFFPVRASDSANGWFLLPWLAYPLVFHAVGVLFGPWLTLKARWVVWRAGLELGFALLAGVVFYYAKAVPVPAWLGERANQFLFMQRPFHFWSHHLLAIFIIGVLLALESSFPKWAARLNWLGRLQWNRNFSVCLVTLLILVHILAANREWVLSTPHRIDWVWLALLILVELLVMALARTFVGKTEDILKLRR